jgi:hypothetical protein
MLLKSLFVLGLFGATVAAATEEIWAAVPANVLRGWRDGAPEALNVTVLSKDETSASRPFGTLPGGSVTTTDVTLTAKVDVVHRTASGVAPGSVIVVRYELTRYTPPPGPPDGSRGIVLNIGEKAAAYLKQTNENNFHLACLFGCLVKL